jgi:prepilin-type N-terminal cleavage/methylation domain-containing protein
MVGKRRGFSLLELLIVVAVIAVLMGILLPALSLAKEMGKRSTCGGNLGAIAKAMALYAAANGDAYPTVPPPTPIFNPTGLWYNPPWTDSAPGSYESMVSAIFTNSNSTTSQNGDPNANLWLLNLMHLTSPKMFICPADPRQPTPASMIYDLFPPVGINDNFGFVDASSPSNTLSYSWSYPWYADDTQQGAWWSNTMDSSLPIGSDMAPSGITTTDDPTGPPGTKISNSKNHSGGAGQNVVFADGHTDFCTTNRVGQGGDNIFTADGNNIYVTQAAVPWQQQFSTNVNLGKHCQRPFDVIMVPAAP